MNDQAIENEAEVTENEAEATETKSIIDPKYMEKYKNKPKDWLATFVSDQVTEVVTKDIVVKDEDGVESMESVETGKTNVDLDKLFTLTQNNHIDTAKMEEQRDRKNAPGRIRMTLGNSLRAAARKRHGLFDLEGEWVDAPAEFVGDTAKTQERDGTPIKVAKPAAEPEQETADAE